MQKDSDQNNPYAAAIFFAVFAILFVIYQKKEDSIHYDTKTLGWVLRLRKEGGKFPETIIEYKYLVDGVWKRGESRVNTRVNSINTRSDIFRKGAYYYVKYDKDQPKYSKLIESSPIPKEKGRKMRDSILKFSK